MTATPGPISAQGTTIKKTASSAIAYLTKIDGLSIKANTIDTTALDTTGGYKTFINGFKEVDDVSIPDSSITLHTVRFLQTYKRVQMQGTQSNSHRLLVV
jgi:predicted secreted protein